MDIKAALDRQNDVKANHSLARSQIAKNIASAVKEFVSGITVEQGIPISTTGSATAAKILI